MFGRQHRVVLTGTLMMCATPVSVLAGAPAGAGRACFDGPPVVAREVYRRFQSHAVSPAQGLENTPTTARFGRCTVYDGAIRSRSKVLARLHCGIEVLAPGMVDDYGFEIGARGRDIEKRVPPDADVRCMPWEKGTYCQITDAGSDVETMRYYLDAPMPGQQDGRRSSLKAKAARAQLARGRVTKFIASIFCH